MTAGEGGRVWIEHFTKDWTRLVTIKRQKSTRIKHDTTAVVVMAKARQRGKGNGWGVRKKSVDEDGCTQGIRSLDGPPDSVREVEGAVVALEEGAHPEQRLEPPVRAHLKIEAGGWGATNPRGQRTYANKAAKETK